MALTHMTRLVMKRKAFAKASRHEHIFAALFYCRLVLGAVDVIDERYRKLLIFPYPNTTLTEIRLGRFVSHHYKRMMAWLRSEDTRH